MKKLMISTLLFSFLPVILSSQQLPLAGVFSSTQYTWNPAMTAPWTNLDAQAVYSRQWVGFENSPQNVSAGFQYPFIRQNSSLGIQLMQDQILPLKQTGVSLMYAYQIVFGGYRRLAVGLMANMSQYRFDATDLVAHDQDDLLLGEGVGATLHPNFAVGLYFTDTHQEYFDRGHFFAGLSAMQVVPSSLIFVQTNEKADFKRDIHVYGLAGYHVELEFSYLEPSLQIVYAAGSLSHFRLNLKYEIYDTFWAGIFLDSSFRAGLQAGVVILKSDYGGLRLGTMASYSMNTNIGRDLGLNYTILIGYQYEI